MNFSKLVGLSSALAVSAMSLVAQEVNPVELRKQLEELLRVQKQQAEQIESLKKQIEVLKGQPAIPGAKAATPDPKLEELERRVSELTDERISKPWRPGDPIGLVRAGQSYLNLSLDGLFAVGGSTANDLGALQPGGHDPNQRGFSVQNIEAVFEGIVDPYFRGQANLIYGLSAAGESTFELEEAYLESLSLPGNLQLKAGQFFTEFGRHNPVHPHAWSFADQPLINGRMFGADGLRNPGARLSWLLPTPFYSELSFTVQNGQGETAESFRSDHGGGVFLGRPQTARGASALRDFIFTPRWQASWELTDAQTLLVGGSAAFGANAAGSDTETQIHGADLTWKWKPANHTKGFPFVTWQTEAMLRKYQVAAYNNAADDFNASGAVGDVGLVGFADEPDVFGDASIRFVPRETLTDYGFYTQVSYGFRPGWVAGARWDYVTSDRAQYENLFGIDAQRDTRWRLSPNLTWHPSEFSKVRLQYNYDQRRHIGVDHSLWLQFEFLLGSHGAHKF
ncbi:MAG: hypothetical protein FD161_3877 [Limisphaerales bacterium]|nr:MAG: hypothetical protein FD161_3877 [Limisphaerales bacterium]KAG0507387.1 MAG: hypothetical protein E1N63_3474 [Limisphaerales bacterium]TXT50729.1 MAG: hypothetical protein FD140_2201 [Limisphaerales bacterium]